MSTLNAKDVATPTDSCPQIQSPSSPPELYSKISVTTRHSPTARVRSQDTKRRVTFQLPQTPRRRPVKSLTPVAPTKFKDKGYLRPSTLSSRSTRNRNKTTSHRHCPTGSSPLMKSSDTLVASPSSPSPTLDPDLDENKLNKIPSLYDTLLPGHGNEKDETSIEFESDGAASQDTSNTTINCEEEANLEECEHAIGDFGPPRTQVFNELELRLFGDIQWDDNQETWDGSGWELSAIPWLAYVGCGGENLLLDGFVALK